MSLKICCKFVNSYYVKIVDVIGLGWFFVKERIEIFLLKIIYRVLYDVYWLSYLIL